MRLVLVLCVSLFSLSASADDEISTVVSARTEEEIQNERSIYFGLTLGAGYAWFEHPGVPFGQLGTSWDMIVGGNVSKNFSVGMVFSTWQFSFLGTPAHLHTFAPRIEWMPADREGLRMSLDAGLGVIDGDLPKSKGGQTSVTVSYHKNLNHWITGGIDTGLRYHFYTDGKETIEPFAAFQFRFHGIRE